MRRFRTLLILGLVLALASAVVAQTSTWNLGSNGSITGTYQLNGTPTIGPGGTALSNGITKYTSSLTPSATTTAYAINSQTFTVTGLSTSDTIWVNGPVPSTVCGMIAARVSSANTLQLDFAAASATSTPCTPPAGTYNIYAVR